MQGSELADMHSEDIHFEVAGLDPSLGEGHWVEVSRTVVQGELEEHQGPIENSG